MGNALFALACHNAMGGCSLCMDDMKNLLSADIR